MFGYRHFPVTFSDGVKRKVYWNNSDYLMPEKFNPETVELTPYRDRQQQATVTQDNLDEAQQAWKANPPELEGEDVTLILDAESGG